MPESDNRPRREGRTRAAAPTSPLPRQIAVWQQQHISEEEGDGQWLNALRDTLPGDRMIVAEGRGRGLVLVVDFATDAQPANGRYYAWGACTLLPEPIPLSEPDPAVFRPSRGPGLRWLQGGPKRLHDDEALRLRALAGGLPPQRLPRRGPRSTDGKTIWPDTGGLAPEAITERLVVNNRRVWRTIGFPSRPEPQRWISRSDRPDLRAPGVVGEVKNRLRSDWGPAQIERYLRTLDREEPSETAWRGVLIHAEPELSSATVARLRQSEYAPRIAVWGAYGGRLNRVLIERQF